MTTPLNERRSDALASAACEGSAGAARRVSPRRAATLPYSYWSAVSTSRREALRAGRTAAPIPATIATMTKATRGLTGSW